MFESFNPFTTNDDNYMDCIDSHDPDVNFFNRFNRESNSCNYYNEEEFHVLTGNLTSNFNVFSTIHLNIRSLPKNNDQFMHLLSTLRHEFSIIALTETWLSDECVELYNIPQYTLVFSNRKERVGGGVAVFAHNQYQIKVRKDLDLMTNETGVESVFVELMSCPVFGGRNVIVGCIYRPPNAEFKSFSDSLTASLDVINKEGKLCYLLGDFNINLIKTENHYFTDNFLNLLYSSYFFPLIDKPTRVTYKTASLIDNIITNTFDYPVNSGILYSDISDHFPIFHITTSNNFKHKGSNVRAGFRKFNEENIKCFRDMVEKINWDDVYDQQDANKSYQSFIHLFKTVFNECFPLVSLKINKRHGFNKPWFTTGFLKSSRKKNRLYKRFISNPTPQNCNIYKKYKNKFTYLLRMAKKKYYSDKFKESTNNVKNTWNIISELLNKKKAPAKYPSLFTDGKSTFSNLSDIANEFNNFFVNVGSTFAKKISPSNNCPTDNITGVFSALQKFEPPTVNEVIDIIVNLNNSAAGHDEIKAKVLKEVVPFISKPLTHVLAVSLKTGVVPSEFKVARVLPLFKEGEPSVFNNYRPISILPCFSKILEKLVYTRVITHLNDNDILYKHQYGFRKKHSTYMALLHLIDKISTALDKNMFAIGIFLDLSKAFDTVDHDILLSRLYRYGFQDVVFKWFSDS